ncbi:TetR/AcrR family transcriptional regulator [Haloechinothrix sp. LS1_15]|nr:TetR/AcrR family transcriptional regulator [Haloechinothrix sp. LS1_15]
MVDAAVAAISVHGPGVSTGQIAAQAGVPRPRLYRHFDDADDLYRAVARRAADLLSTSMSPVLEYRGGTAWELIETGVRTFVIWLSEHTDLYRYVMHRAVQDTEGVGAMVTDIRAALAARISEILRAYLNVLGLDTRIADPAAFGLIGLVESAARRWMNEPNALSREEFIHTVTGWVWGVVHHTLRDAGVELDPHEPLPSLPD